MRERFWLLLTVVCLTLPCVIFGGCNKLISKNTDSGKLQLNLPWKSSSSKGPTINFFAASPEIIAAGGVSTLSWSVTGATSVVIEPGVGTVNHSGSVTVKPAETTVYGLIATNAKGGSTAGVEVTVTGSSTPVPPVPIPPAPSPTNPPEIRFFGANAYVIAAGDYTSLSWDVANAASVIISPGVGSVGPAGTAPVSPTATTLYTLTATNASGSRSAVVNLKVSGAVANKAPVVSYFTASPTTIMSGTSSVLSWSVFDATEVVISPGIGSVPSAGSVTVAPPQTTQYILAADNSIGSSIQEARVTVTGSSPPNPPAPAPGVSPEILHFAATKAVIASGEYTSLNWNVSNASTVAIMPGVGYVGAQGTAPVAPTSTTSYMLVATNAAGSRSATARIEVSGAFPNNVPPSIYYFTASPGTISPGGSSTLSWEVTNADSVSIYPDVGYVDPVKSVSVKPSATTEYVLEAYNSGVKRSWSVTVNVSGSQPSPPQPAQFAVTGVTAKASPAYYKGPCPSAVNFAAVITASGPGTVTYAWENSKGGKTAGSITFTGAGSQTIAGPSWQVDTSGLYWNRLHVLTPNDMASDNAGFEVACCMLENANFSGKWDVSGGAFGSYPSYMYLTQTGNQVTGTYDYQHGSMSGTVSCGVMKGTWAEEPSYGPPHDSGPIELTISDDYKSFRGLWEYASPTEGRGGSVDGRKVQ